MSVIPGITEEVLLDSIYQYIKGKLGLRIAEVPQNLGAAPSSEDEQNTYSYFDRTRLRSNK